MQDAFIVLTIEQKSCGGITRWELMVFSFPTLLIMKLMEVANGILRMDGVILYWTKKQDTKSVKIVFIVANLFTVILKKTVLY